MTPPAAALDRLDPATVDRIVASRGRLLAWYRRHRRDLPWRRTGDPYAIWVSEVMLQQTRVEAVVPHYRRFLDRFPDTAALAAADVEDVLAAWSGLGYYRRARALHEGARAVVERHGGRVPDDLEALLALPGVGRYTAGAVASIAYGVSAPVLDGNVRRVLLRLLGPGGDGLGGGGATDRALWGLAEALVRGPSPGDLNQALMELGATVCLPRTPRCEGCPVRGACAGAASGRPGSWPPPRARRPQTAVRVGVAVLRRGGRVLLERPAERSPLRGTWDLPAVELTETGAAGDEVAAEIERRHGLRATTGPVVARLAHGILDRSLRLEVLPGTVVRGRVAGRSDLRWVDPAAIDGVAVSGATRKVLRRLSDR